MSGSVTAVAALIDRLLPSLSAASPASSHFQLSFSSNGGKCFSLDDAPGGKIAISAQDTSTLSAGVGFYLRERCNMTIGWARGGGDSGLSVPAHWPTMAASGGAATRCRLVDHLYFMNVCTHSYSLVWYGWHEWQLLLDWMAISGINNFLAMTGQEEVAYRALTGVGLSDEDVRGWFNGPAFLTWSRGQNEYGAGIAGPLPRSFMKSQFELQKLILGRARSLGMVGQLPGFQVSAHNPKVPPPRLRLTAPSKLATRSPAGQRARPAQGPSSRRQHHQARRDGMDGLSRSQLWQDRRCVDEGACRLLRHRSLVPSIDCRSLPQPAADCR